MEPIMTHAPNRNTLERRAAGTRTAPLPVQDGAAPFQLLSDTRRMVAAATAAGQVRIWGAKTSA